MNETTLETYLPKKKLAVKPQKSIQKPKQTLAEESMQKLKTIKHIIEHSDIHSALEALWRCEHVERA